MSCELSSEISPIVLVDDVDSSVLFTDEDSNTNESRTLNETSLLYSSAPSDAEKDSSFSHELSQLSTLELPVPSSPGEYLLIDSPVNRSTPQQYRYRISYSPDPDLASVDSPTTST